MDHDTTLVAALSQAQRTPSAPPQRRQTDRPGASHPADHARFDHYPTLLIDTWHLPDGTRITQRPVLPQDGPLLGQLMERLSALAKRQRFHGSVNALTPAWLDRLSCVDYQQHLALVMTTQSGQQPEQIIAEARYVVDPTGNSAEFALMVDEAWQRCGLGLRAMQVLEAAAERAGLRWLHGTVLANNLPMLKLMQVRGYSGSVAVSINDNPSHA